MDINLYDNIFKRKSFHLFRNTGNQKITEDELKEINEAFNSFLPLDKTIKVKTVIEKCDTRGAEYAILFYSEKKNNYLENIGYLGEQLDLYLVSKNIGTLWFGIGKPKESTYENLDYVIMILFKKIDDITKFRRDMYKSKRKDLDDTWHLDNYHEIGNIVRFAPSACNTQPWDVSKANNEILIKRVTKKRGIMPKDKAVYYNSIDLGIYMCFLDLCLEKNNIKYEKTLASSNLNEVEILTSTYRFL